MPDTFNILDYTEGPLMKTGQTLVFTPAGRTCGDDGVNRAGIAGSQEDAQYQILTTGQYSGTVAITIGALTDTHSNECVFDKVTGLMWQRTASAAVFGVGTEDLFWDSPVLLEDIFNYCDKANLAALSGFTNWRIPNIKELLSLCRIYFGNPGYPNVTAWPTLASNVLVWSSTTRAENTAQGYQLAIQGMLTTSSAKTTLRRKVLLVSNP